MSTAVIDRVRTRTLVPGHVCVSVSGRRTVIDLVGIGFGSVRLRPKRALQLRAALDAALALPDWDGEHPKARVAGVGVLPAHGALLLTMPSRATSLPPSLLLTRAEAAEVAAALTTATALGRPGRAASNRRSTRT